MLDRHLPLRDQIAAKQGNRLMPAMQCLLFRCAMNDPSDVSGLEALFDDGKVEPGEVVAILGKTEGNGCVNDFSRGYAVASLRALLARRMNIGVDATAHVPMVMSGGVEGGISPHFLIFAVRETTRECEGLSLALGVAATRKFEPWEIGRMAQVNETARAVREAMASASIRSASDVHLVQIKCPLLTQQRINHGLAEGIASVTEDTYSSMGFSRGASALGVALALGELEDADLSDDVICRDFGKWSGRASTSAGNELDHNEIIVLGNSPDWASDDVISHAVMNDAIDVDALHDVLATLKLQTERQLDADKSRRIKAVIAKAEPSTSSLIRGSRHIMWDDSDINPTRHARALVGGVLAGVIGRTDLFISGGAEHQGPDGGGPVAVIASRS